MPAGEIETSVLLSSIFGTEERASVGALLCYPITTSTAFPTWHVARQTARILIKNELLFEQNHDG
mgnify:CR=1 FL=1